MDARDGVEVVRSRTRTLHAWHQDAGTNDRIVRRPQGPCRVSRKGDSEEMIRTSVAACRRGMPRITPSAARNFGSQSAPLPRDWSARRSHLAGSLARAFLSRFEEKGWAKRERGNKGRALLAVGRESIRAYVSGLIRRLSSRPFSRVHADSHRSCVEVGGAVRQTDQIAPPPLQRHGNLRTSG